MSKISYDFIKLLEDAMISQRGGVITEIRAATDDGGQAVISRRKDGNYDVEVNYPGRDHANDLGRGLTMDRAIDRLGPKAAAKVRQDIVIVRNA